MNENTNGLIQDFFPKGTDFTTIHPVMVAKVGGSGKLDSVLSGGLASRKPPSSGEPKERGNEPHETESRSVLQGAGGLGRRHMRN